MFKGTTELGLAENFTFEKYYKLIDNFKANKDLTVKEIKGDGSTILFVFKIEKQDLYISLDTKYKHLTISFETYDCTLDEFNDYYKELCFQAEEFKPAKK